jgi:hypothetical protein
MAKAHDPLPCVNFVFDPPMRSMITKLIGIKINLINQNKINTKNNLVAINVESGDTESELWTSQKCGPLVYETSSIYRET